MKRNSLSSDVKKKNATFINKTSNHLLFKCYIDKNG